MLISKWTKPVDFFATRTHYVDHLAPVFLALDENIRGEFYVPASLVEHAKKRGVDAIPLRAPGRNTPLQVTPPGDGPLAVAAYGDLQKAYHNKRPILFFEHGIGLTFPHNAYAGGRGLKRYVSCFFDPNERVRELNQRAHPDTPGFVMGSPKMDPFFSPSALRASPPNASHLEEKNLKPVVCISFHWDGSVIAPEAGNAFAHYRGVIGELAKQDDFTLIGHGHPRAMAVLTPFYESLGIEVVSDFDEVMQRADLYVNDCSSTLYEFCATGKPVVILNAPQFRKNLHLGIRFWDLADVGPQVEKAEELLPVIREQLAAGKETYEMARARAVQELFPYWGCAAERAAKCIEEFIESKMPRAVHVTEIDGESVGILYMGFGEKAAREIRKSMMSLRNTGVTFPMCVVGDTPVIGAQFIEWTGECPFDPKERENFQFRAGRIKPYLYELSPFQRTLYIDADTEFMSDIRMGFLTLGEFDLAIAEEKLGIGELYNKPRAGWEINIMERDATMEELEIAPETKFLNSGVIFFRKCEGTKAVFEAWGREWLRWQQWDEQLALMRALYRCDVSYYRLGIDWNHPHREKAGIIFHNYGRGAARMNIEKELA